MTDIIQAKFTPRDTSRLDTRVVECCVGKGKIYSFVFAYTLKGDDYLELIDKNFSSSSPVNIKNLTIIK